MRCPKCKTTLAAKARKCTACGYVLPVDQKGTLDPSKFVDTSDSSQEASQPSLPAESGASKAQPLNPVGSTPDSDVQETVQLSESMDIGDLEEFSIEDDLMKTANFSDSDSDHTIDLDSAGLADQPADSDVQATVLYDESGSLPVNPSQATVDFVSHDATVQEMAPASGSKHGTVEYDSKELKEAAGRSTDSGGTGSAGRLNRIWGGAGGSGSNPMHTLKGGGAMASDSIFERVANRVLVADKAQTIIENDVKRVADRESVQRCLQTACQLSPSALADYHINGFLGKGGMGIVMQARQSAIGRDVALKMILPSTTGSQTTSSTKDQQKKFLYEAQVTGKLDHPNIVPVYDLGVSNSVLFYSMKKIIGKEWTERISEFTPEENLDVWMKVADAMAFSHQRSIIHRDLKPDNVMLGPFGEVLVTDWGCAVDLSQKEKFNGAGSPPWMAPEMANHRVEKIGTRSDIFLLGAILYQIIQGYPPHPGRTAMEVLRAAANNQIIPVESPDPLMKIAMRAMETQPEDRYSTVEEMQDAIRQYRRHSESIALTERSETTLAQAVSSKDYERFSRSVFGFRDALELWPENNAASTGLCKARYAYSECAYARKDYDLCLATLDRSEPDENALYVRAEKAKKAIEDRSKWLKLTLGGLAAAIVLGFVVSAAFAVYASIQKGIAEEQKIIAEKQKDLAVKNEAEAVKQKGIAEQQTDLAKKNEADAITQKGIAEQQTELAKKNEAEAITQKGIAEQQTELARKNEAEAVTQKGIAEQQTVLARTQTARVELASLQSNLSLALGQVEQLDVGRATELLSNLALPESYSALAAKNQLPKLQNWAWNRINLLTNRDLLQDPWGERVTALAYATQANVGAVATADRGKHRLQIIRLDRNRMVADEQLSLDLGARPAESILISPDGTQVVYALRSENNQDSVYRWRLSESQASPVSSAQSRSMQGFVATNDAVVGGLNNGLWVWRNSADASQEPERISEIQGRLLSIQLLDNNQVLVLAQMADGARHPHFVSLDQKDQREFLRVDQALKNDRLSAVAYSSGRLILGTESGRMYSRQYSPGTNLSPVTAGGERKDFGVDLVAETLIEIPQQHISAIKSIVAHDRDGTLISLAEEPLVHVWKVDNTPSGFRHHTRLTGTTKNVNRAAFISNSDHILAVAEDGRSIVWDAVRQRQRQQVRRVMADGVTPANYDAPVVAVVPCDDQQHAISILENGRIDRWNTQTGQSVHQSDVPMAYIGHDPNAQFVDMAIDEQAGILITSAKISDPAAQVAQASANNVQQAGSNEDQPISSIVSTQWTWEFVKWDLNTGLMLDRWTRTASEEQTVSLSGGARYVLYGSDENTLLRQPAREGSEAFFKQDFGSHMGYVNPRATNLLMLVKLNGVVRVVDTDRLEETWNQPGYQLSQEDFFRAATKGDRTIIGQWAADGKAFYLVWDSGRVTELLWSDNQLRIGRDLHNVEQRLDLRLPVNPNAESSVAAKANSVRLGSRWNIDMKVRGQGSSNIVTAAVRFPGSDGLTRLTRIAFPAGDGATTRQQSESKMGRRQYVLTDDDLPRLETQSLELLKERLPNMSRRVAGTRTLQSDTFVATREGNVYRVSNNRVRVFGRPGLLSASGDRSGNTIITLHEGGVLWRADWKDDHWNWRQLDLVPQDAKQISLSPNGKELMIQLDASGLVVSADSGQPLDYLGDAASLTATAWQPNCDATLAAVLSDGNVKIISQADSRLIGNLGSRQAKSVSFFSEAWNDANRPLSSWLAIHCQSGDGMSNNEIVYLSLDPAQPKELSLPLTAQPTVIECSPQEGLIAVGGQGTVTVYLAAPTMDEAGKELFSLQGHSGAELRSIRFSSDGKTLVTSDNQNRVYGWLSEDALQGVTNELAVTVAANRQQPPVPTRNPERQFYVGQEQPADER